MTESSRTGNLLVIGAGGHAKSVITAVDAGDRYRVVTVLTERPEEIGGTLLGREIVGYRQGIDRARATGIRDAIVAIGDNEVRERISRNLTTAGFSLVSIIHPLAWIAPESHIEPGCFVHAFAVIGAECRIGQGVVVSAQAVIGHDTVVHGWSHIAPGVRIGGGALIGTGAFLGMGCAILPRVKIGAKASIGANSVVHRNIPDGAIVAGNPARMIKSG